MPVLQIFLVEKQALLCCNNCFFSPNGNPEGKISLLCVFRNFSVLTYKGSVMNCKIVCSWHSPLASVLFSFDEKLVVIQESSIVNTAKPPEKLITSHSIYIIGNSFLKLIGWCPEKLIERIVLQNLALILKQDYADKMVKVRCFCITNIN